MTAVDGISLEIAALAAAYATGSVTPESVIGWVYDRIEAYDDPAVWTALVPREDALGRARDLPDAVAGFSLYGVPFAVKDNIDVAGMPTTAACPDFAYVAEASAPLVDALTAAGAILIGKNNMDQFATGLSGMRSPYGTPRNPAAPHLVPGGSSSGSAAAVSAGLVSFSIGTDTAGSGRVPAALQSIVGLKPSRGLVSTSGLIPACRSLDCPSVFALTVPDAAHVLSLIAGRDESDPWSRELPIPPASVATGEPSALRIGVPSEEALQWPAGSSYRASWGTVLEQLSAAGAEVVEIDFAPFVDTGRLLYSGPWIAERWVGLAPFITAHPDAVHPVTRAVLAPGADITGAAVFAGLTAREALRSAAEREFARVDVMLTPTSPIAFTLEQMTASPIERNAELGRYTTFANLLDLASIAVPAGIASDGAPFGVTVHARAGQDALVAQAGEAVARICAGGVPPTAASRPTQGTHAMLALAVVGAHLEGMPLHGDLLALGALLERRTHTAAAYRLVELATTPPKPGLIRVSSKGSAVEVEVYRVPKHSVGQLLASIAAPLGLGSVMLADGTEVHGFVCEAWAGESALDITEFGGWRAFREHADT